MKDASVRFEMKYRITYYEYLQIRNALSIYMQKDKFTKRAGGKGYFVRSLYYDTLDYASYHQKMAGDNERVKLRIRTYSPTPDKDSPIRVELKMRKRNLVIKKSRLINFEEYENFANTGRWSDENDLLLSEFENHRLSKMSEPKLIIEYFRECYETKVPGGLRITFDHEVKSAHSDELFPEHSFYRPHYPGIVIMEIKFKDEVPAWVKKLVHTYGLRIIANSKFTQGLQACRHDLAHPGGIVTIR